MKLKIKRISALLLVISVLFAATACENGGVKTVNVGCFPNLTHAQALYEKSDPGTEGFFGGKTVIRWYQFNAGPAEMESFRAGRLDIGYIGPIPAITGYVGTDENIRIIAGAVDGGSLLVVRKDSHINSVEELSGKTVAVPQFGNTQDILLRMLLADAGLKTKDDGGDVTVIQQDNANISSLFEKKQIDAALVPEPWGSRIAAGNNARVLLDHDGILNGAYPVAVLVVRKDFLDKNRELVKDFLKAHITATEKINENKIAAAEVINGAIEGLTGVRLEQEILETSFGRFSVSYELNTKSIEAFAAMAKAQGIISRDVKAEDIVDLSVLEEALKELGK